MAVHRYAVLDKDGVKINQILVQQEFAEAYWPGYGSFLLDEGAIPEEPRPAPPPPKPADFGVVKLTPSKQMQIGDRIDLATGEVTAAVAAVAEVLP